MAENGIFACLNCTFMELKFGDIDSNASTETVLIVPLWN